MNLLFICTHNRCRSILCEAITNHLSDGSIKAYSAGSQPAGEVHPLSLKYLAQRGINTTGLRSKSWDEFGDKDIDVAITVCDSAASESCPLWMGNSLKVHWGLSDPSKLQASDAEIEAAFMQLIDRIKSRVGKLMQLNLNSLDSKAQKQALLQIAMES